MKSQVPTHIVNPDAPSALHLHIAKRLGQSASWGDDLLDHIPEMNAVIESPAVVAALREMLGGGYFRLPHVAVHVSEPYAGDIHPHQDRLTEPVAKLLGVSSVPAKGPPTVAFAFYYPTGAREDEGPTVVYPGAISKRQPGKAGVPIVLAAGAVVVADFRLWHARAENRTATTRWMVKFLFASKSLRSAGLKRCCPPWCSGRLSKEEII